MGGFGISVTPLSSPSLPLRLYPIKSFFVNPIAALNNKPKLSYEFKEGQTQYFHQLASGLKMEVIEQRGITDGAKKLGQPLVFVHGSYHAAWCWAEHWLPFFSGFGFDCYAVSLLGQGESDTPFPLVPGNLETHASDIGDFIQKKLTQPPILVGHSFGGLVVQYYIARIRNKQFAATKGLFPDLSGAALLCSVPPTGNSGIVWRYIFTKPIVAYKVTLSLAAKAFQTDLSLCRETYFSQAMDNHLLMRYQKLMTESSRTPMFDLRKLNASLPVPSVPKSAIEIFILGSSDDMIVDRAALEETGRFYGVSPICIDGVGHDIMLDCLWKVGAGAVLSWLNSLSCP